MITSLHGVQKVESPVLALLSLLDLNLVKSPSKNQISKYGKRLLLVHQGCC